MIRESLAGEFDILADRARHSYCMYSLIWTAARTARPSLRAARPMLPRPALALLLLSSKAMLAACFAAVPPTARAAACRRVPPAPAMGWLDDVVGKVKDATREVTVQHILLPSQSDARDLWRELEAAGVTSESFGRAAAARSTCESPSQNAHREGDSKRSPRRP